MRIAALALLLAIAALNGGCALLAAGAVGGAIGFEMSQPHAPPGYRWCVPAGGGPPFLCRWRRPHVVIY